MASVTDLGKISIITPFFNPGEFLTACIESIQKQTYSNWELLLVNDFSTDNSLSIARSFVDLDPRIKLFENQNKGLIPALRIAYDNSSGVFLTRMDADDVMLPNRLESMINRLTELGPKHVCVGKVKYFSQNELGAGYIKYEEWLNNLTDRETNFKEIYRERSIPSPNFMIHRSDFDQIGGFEPDDYPEDYDLAFRMYLYGMKICGIDEITLLWRDHNSRSTRTQEHYKPLTFIPLKVKYFLQIDRDILNKLRDLVIETFNASHEGEVKDGMDISLLAIDKESKKIEFAGANNPLWIAHNSTKEMETVKADKQPIGKFDHAVPFSTHELQLSEGDCLYIFTDGYADQFGGMKGKKLKYKPFQDMLIANMHLPMHEQKGLIEDAFTEWMADFEQVDDVCVIGIRL